MRLTLGFGLLSFLFLIAPGCSSADGPAAPDGAENDLIGGTVAADRFPATVKLILPRGAKCGAAKIGPRRFLTASHCVTEGGVAADYSLTIVGVSGRETTANIKRAVSSPFEIA